LPKSPLVLPIQSRTNVLLCPHLLHRSYPVGLSDWTDQLIRGSCLIHSCGWLSAQHSNQLTLSFLSMIFTRNKLFFKVSIIKHEMSAMYCRLAIQSLCWRNPD
jgi:hypothetical protein